MIIKKFKRKSLFKTQKSMNKQSINKYNKKIFKTIKIKINLNQFF